MLAYPAVDVLDGNVVRLSQGDFERSTTYASTPLDAALAWVEQGAERLHVVDLDGARAGEPVNLASVRAIVEQSGVPVQLGGGLRSIAAVDLAASTGVARIIIGTAALDGSRRCAATIPAGCVGANAGPIGNRPPFPSW